MKYKTGQEIMIGDIVECGIEYTISGVRRDRYGNVEVSVDGAPGWYLANRVEFISRKNGEREWSGLTSRRSLL